MAKSSDEGAVSAPVDGLGETRFQDPRTIQESERFQKLYEIEESLLSAITEEMRDRGYDKSQPVIVWKNSPEGPILIDGHTRKRAAIAAGLKKIPVFFITGASREEVELYAHKLQLTGGT